MADVFGTVTAAIGLAATVFQTAKGIRDTIHLAMSEDEEIADLLEENQAEVGLLIKTYNTYKEILDQHQLTEDLEQLLARVVKLHKFLIESKDETPDRKRPSLKAVWKAGDLRPKLEALNRGIVCVRTHWKEHIDIRTLALLSKSTTETMERLEHQDRMQTNATLTVTEAIRAEATEVIKVILHTTVQTRARSLSVHSQVEPDGFTSSTTRVAVNTYSSLVTFSILSPDASLSYDQIKMRIEEYSQALKSDSPTIEFFTKQGKTIICRKNADKMEQQLQQAKDLLQAMIEAKDVPTIEVIHRLCDLATVLDQVKLQEECFVVGDCAIRLAQALGSWALEFQKEQAETISLIAGLGAYESRARPLFIQAISVCEAFAIEDGAESAKLTLIELLIYAGKRGIGYPVLRCQWLVRAMALIADLPSTILTIGLRGTIFLIC